MLFLCTTTATDSNWTRMFVVCDSHLQLSWSCWSWHDRTTVNTVSLAVSLFLLVTVQRRLSFWCLTNLQPENEFYTGHTKIGSTGLDQCLVSAELRYQKERKSDQVWLTWGLAKTLYHCLTAHVSSDFLVMSPCSQISEMNVLTVMLPIEIMTKTDIQVVKTKQNKTKQEQPSDTSQITHQATESDRENSASDDKEESDETEREQISPQHVTTPGHTHLL